MDDSYESLRDWYLARLRRLAIEHASSDRLTPMSLVKADAEVVAAILSARVENPGASTNSASLLQLETAAAQTHDIQQGAINILVVTCSVTGALLLCAIMMFLLSSEAPVLVVFSMLVSAVLSALGGLIFSYYFYNKYVVESLNGISMQLQSVLPADIARRFERASLLARISCWFSHLTRLYKESTVRERAIVDYSVQMLCALDNKGNFTAVNPTAERLLGYDSEQLKQNSLIHHAHEDDRSLTQQMLDAARDAKGVSIQFTNRMRACDGHIVHIQWLMEWSAKGASFFCSGQDISERMELERLKKEFISMITHDLRSPLGSIVTSAQLIQSEELNNADSAPLVKGIEKTAKRLLSLVSELLDIDKFEANMLQVDKTELALGPVFETAVESVRSLADTKQIQIDTVGSEIVAFVDELRLVQVITNLLSNAIKFSPRKSTINLIALMLPGDKVVEIRVQDHGRGIADEYQSKIFDRFKQVEIADASLRGGSGLGLAICKAIVEAHGGTLGLRSKPGEGSTFWLRFPGKPPAVVAATAGGGASDNRHSDSSGVPPA